MVIFYRKAVSNIKTKNVDFVVGTTKYFSGPKPIECPHCGSYVSPVLRNVAGYTYEDSKVIYLSTFRGDCCSKDFFGLYDIRTSTGLGSLLIIYPSHKSILLPDAIHKISPRFVSMYEQCYIAEQNGHLELAGTGFRNAIEILVKDFAISELGHTQTEVVKKKLADAIKTYLPSIDLQQSADVVRILGNDYTHYNQKYDDVSFPILKAYVDIFIKSIETTYLIKHPPVPTQFKSSETE